VATTRKTTRRKAAPAPARRAAKPKGKAKRTTRSRPARSAPVRGEGAARTAPRRADFGAPIDGFFARQPPHLRAILVELRGLVEAAAPEATASIKWGMPFFAIGEEMMCALGAHEQHVNLVLSGPPGTYADPGGRLEGEGRTGRHLKVTALDALPREAVRGWLRTAAERARKASAREEAALAVAASVRTGRRRTPGRS
jgi:hypothetical protein